MENLNSKNKNSIIAIILISAMIASSIFAILPTDSAQTVTVQKYPTFIYGAVAPNPVGTGQPVTIVAWTAEMPPDIGEIAGTVTSPSTRAGWYGLTMTLTEPDNTSQTIALPYTDPVGNTYYSIYTNTSRNILLSIPLPRHMEKYNNFKKILCSC